MIFYSLGIGEGAFALDIKKNQNNHFVGIDHDH